MTAPATDIEWALETITKRADRYKLYRDYYGGNHRVAFATDKWRSTFGALFAAFADNLCPAIVDAVVDRLQLDGLKSVGELLPGETDPNADLLDNLWDSNRMARRSGEVHLEALREGDAYVIVWPAKDPALPPVITPQKANRMCVDYDEGADTPGTIRVAAKVWPLNGKGTKWALNLYYADRIEKLETSSLAQSGVMPEKPEAWGPRIDKGEAGSSLPHTYGRVPVFHFANNASTGEAGVSELKDWVPLQDALNKSVADMLVAMEFQALPQRWIAGLEIVYDEQGNVVPAFEPGADRIWQFVSENTKSGQFEAADLEKFIKVSDSLRAEGARVTRTPLHYLLLEGRFPSGDALEVATQPLDSKVTDRRGSFGEAWEDLGEFAFALMGRTDVDLEALWGERRPNDELKHAQAVQAKVDLGISKRQGLRELGYSEQQIDLFEAENEANAPQIAQAAVDAFNRGDPAAFGGPVAVPNVPNNGAVPNPAVA